MGPRNVLSFPEKGLPPAADGLQCIRISGRPTWDIQSTQLHNDAYEFWKPFWADVFQKVGEKEKPSADDFVRQDIFTILKHNSAIAALHGYAFFDMEEESNREHSFFRRAFNDDAMQAIDSYGARRIMTWEFFSVAPQWQGKSNGFSMGTVLLSIGIKSFLASQADMLLGVGRVDVGAAKMAYGLGGVSLGPTIQLHGIPTDLVGILKTSAKLTEKPIERAIVEKIWSNRLDLFQTEPSTKRAA